MTTTLNLTPENVVIGTLYKEADGTPHSTTYIYADIAKNDYERDVIESQKAILRWADTGLKRNMIEDISHNHWFYSEMIVVAENITFEEAQAIIDLA